LGHGIKSPILVGFLLVVLLFQVATFPPVYSHFEGPLLVPVRSAQVRVTGIEIRTDVLPYFEHIRGDAEIAIFAMLVYHEDSKTQNPHHEDFTNLGWVRGGGSGLISGAEDRIFYFKNPSDVQYHSAWERQKVNEVIYKHSPECYPLEDIDMIFHAWEIDETGDEILQRGLMAFALGHIASVIIGAAATAVGASVLTGELATKAISNLIDLLLEGKDGSMGSTVKSIKQKSYKKGDTDIIEMMSMDNNNRFKIYWQIEYNTLPSKVWGNCAEEFYTLIRPPPGGTGKIIPPPGGTGSTIPRWIQHNAGWWAENQIDDASFIGGIQYLIKENIMIIPISKFSGTDSDKFPSWIKNNAGWWAAGLISDTDFVLGIQYLIGAGIISISPEENSSLPGSDEEDVSPPTLISPIGTVLDNPPYFDWTDVPGATYALHLFSSDNQLIAYHEDLTVSNWSEGLFLQQTFSWKVIATLDSGEILESDIATFTIQPVNLDTDGDGIPDSIDSCPTEAENYNGYEDTDGCPDEDPGETITPAIAITPNGIVSGGSQVFDWTDVPGATYNLQIFKDGQIVVIIPGLTESNWSEGSFNEDTFTWKVIATVDGQSVVSNTVSFTIQPAPSIEMDISQIDTSFTIPNDDDRILTYVVHVLDSNQNPVSGATVNLKIAYGAQNDFYPIVSDANGQATIEITYPICNEGQDYIGTVTNISKSGYTYNSSLFSDVQGVIISDC